jgi:hypothetical protein
MLNTILAFHRANRFVCMKTAGWSLECSTSVLTRRTNHPPIRMPVRAKKLECGAGLVKMRSPTVVSAMPEHEPIEEVEIGNLA